MQVSTTVPFAGFHFSTLLSALLHRKNNDAPTRDCACARTDARVVLEHQYDDVVEHGAAVVLGRGCPLGHARARDAHTRGGTSHGNSGRKGAGGEADHDFGCEQGAGGESKPIRKVAVTICHHESTSCSVGGGGATGYRYVTAVVNCGCQGLRSLGYIFSIEINDVKIYLTF